MKKIMLTGVIASVVLASLLPLNMQQRVNRTSAAMMASSIAGRISPIDGAELIWAISATDSIKMIVASGTFSSPLKPANYKLFIDARSPYKDVLLDNVDIKENQVLDIGEIILQQ
jgi:hypothetical protein